MTKWSVITLVLNPLTCDIKASMSFYADFCLLIQTPIDTSIARVYHLLSMIKLLLQAQLCSSCLLPAKECRETYFELSLALRKGIRCNSAHKDSVVQHNESAKKLSCQQQQAESRHMLNLIWWATKHFSLGSFQHFLLVLLPHMNDTLSISIYKELQNHQLSTSPLFSYKWWYETSANNVFV